MKQSLILLLQVVAAIPPPIPAKQKCIQPEKPKTIQCNETGLTHKLETQRRLALMLLFSFEVDTLVITLHEVLDLVDVVFLVESTLTHKAV